METINDLYNEFVAACGTEAPTRTMDEVQSRFWVVGGSNYREHGQAFLDAAFEGGNPGEWPWGGEWTGPDRIETADE